MDYDKYESYDDSDYSLCVKQVDECCNNFQKSSENFEDKFNFCVSKQISRPVSYKH